MPTARITDVAGFIGIFAAQRHLKYGHRVVDLDYMSDKVLSMTFKPITDNMREAPSLAIVPAIVGCGAKMRVVDLQVKRKAEALLPGVSWMHDAHIAALGADAVAILIAWNDFWALGLKLLAKTMKKPRLADLRDIFSAEVAKRAGFDAYQSIELC
jgi:UDPglucose 6-dehydrogenase